MKKANAARIVVAMLVLACATAPGSRTAWAQESDRGSLRDRLKQRWIEKQKQKPSPTDRTDVRSPLREPGDYRFVITHGGARRMYRIHVPVKYDPGRPAPVVFAFHGGGGNMDDQADDKYYGQVSTSEREGFIAVFPNGYSRLPSGKLATWNAGACCAAARDENVDDVGFVKTIVDNLTVQLNIDRKRIFATGMSNGGMMSYRLACEMADTFTAIAAVAGADGMATCIPREPISILHIHAKDDEHVLFGGGAGAKSQNKSLVTDFRSVPDTVSRWVRLNSCEPTPKRTLDAPGAYCEVYSPCKGGVKVGLCVTESGGHSWPGGVKVRTGESGSTAIVANDVMWDFWNQ